MLTFFNQSVQIFNRLYDTCLEKGRVWKSAPLRIRTSLRLPAKLKKPLKFLLYSGLVLIVIISVLMGFAMDDTPQNVNWQGLNRDDIQRAKQLLHIEPAELDSTKNLSLNQKDLNIALSYLLSHFVENTAEVVILDDRVLFQIAIFAPPNPWGRYLDLHFALKQKDNAIVIKSFKIGEISIPDPAANVLVPWLIQHSSLQHDWQEIAQYIRQVRITPPTVEISYSGRIVDAARQLAIGKHKNYPNLYLYQRQINEIVSAHDPAWRLSLSEIMQPLFLAALHRSRTENAIQENRSILIAIASYIYKSDLRNFLPLGLVYNKEYLVFAYKRNDIPQHFIASALLTAVESTLFSQQLGIDKEVGDSRKGSGFSFIDISADRAGTRFGQEAVASPERARRFQEKIAAIKDYTAFLPDIDGLPEHMDEQTFKEKYEGIDSDSYKEVIRLIDSRIAALPVYRD